MLKLEKYKDYKLIDVRHYQGKTTAETIFKGLVVLLCSFFHSSQPQQEAKLYFNEILLISLQNKGDGKIQIYELVTMKELKKICL